MLKYFSSQPHQPFFTFGILFFISFLFVLSFSYMGVFTLNGSITLIHSYPMIHIIFVQFFLGFLFVVFPRFLTQAEVKQHVYMNRFFLFALGGITYIISLFISPLLTQIAMILLLCASLMSFRTLLKIYQKSIVKDKKDTKFILIAFGFGIISNLFIFISTFGYSSFKTLGVYIGFYLFLFALIFTISQRMIPFFTSVKVQNYKINKSKYLLEIGFVLLGLKVISLGIQNPLFSFVVDTLLFCFFTYELLKWKLPAFEVSAIMWVLYLSLFWIPIGFLISLLESTSNLFDLSFIFEKASIHALAVGYFSTVLIGFGTRVILGHSGRTPTSDKFTTIIFWAIQAIVILRIFASIGINFDFNYIHWVILSAFLLAIGLIIWSIKYLKILIKG